MKKLFSFLVLIFLVAGIQGTFSQEKKETPKIYDPQADARLDINNAVQQANTESKHVFVQVGGNWCPWCIRFHGYINADPEIKKLLDDNYVYVLLNYSTENRNAELLKSFGNPGRMGYPVFLILDRQGRLIHTQDSGLLEEGQSYNKNKVMTFLRNWSPEALDLTRMK